MTLPSVSQPVESAPSASPRRGRPSRRAQIFASALRLFRERGFHATSINDIGADAGVAGTAIYSHFATKRDLLAEAIREGARRIHDAVMRATADDERRPEEALEDLVRAYVEVVVDNADMNACYVLEARNLETATREPMVRGERGLHAIWRRTLRAARPELDEDQARVMVQMALFSLVAICVHRNRFDRDTLVGLATSQLLGALHGPVPVPNP